jgi:rhodanese-related sulfurtransferase
MPIKQTTPADAYARLQADDTVAYLDVRTEPEFERGHAPKSINVPVVFLDPGAPARPNPDFVDVVAKVLRPHQEILVGCQVGGRSQRACEILAQAGYTNLANIQGGFGGARDRAGNLVAKGWVDSSLPVETGAPAGRSYADLKAKA